MKMGLFFGAWNKMDGFSESWGSRTEEMLRLSVMPTFGHEHKKMETIPSQTKA